MRTPGGIQGSTQGLVLLREANGPAHQPKVLFLPGMEGGIASLEPLAAFAWVGMGELWAAELPSEESISGAAHRLVRRLAGVGLVDGSTELLIMGFSIGGLIGLELAHQLIGLGAPRVRGVLLVGSLPWAWKGWNRGLSRLVARLPDGLYRRLHHAKMARNMRQDGVPERAVFHMLSEGPSAGSSRARLKAVRDWSGPRAPTCPVLWLKGRDDREANWKIDEVQSILPWARFIEIEGGHWPQWTHPLALELALRQVCSVQGPTKKSLDGE
jgi:pimeloyl-ACP methyl ester carboxylesterase